MRSRKLTLLFYLFNEARCFFTRAFVYDLLCFSFFVLPYRGLYFSLPKILPEGKLHSCNKIQNLNLVAIIIYMVLWYQRVKQYVGFSHGNFFIQLICEEILIPGRVLVQINWFMDFDNKKPIFIHSFIIFSCIYSKDKMES